ncbi:unnamed protein product [Tuber aestivum]|uniref:CENP-C homolog n=1 Tax=Tuber aestivum TaxID=59557 RepID=A0A292PU66_9PEZI|nr:unnamed protein product [Tuber aestivum]
MAPGSPSQRKARETNFTDIGVAGRKTGIMVKDTGQRNAFGMEHMDAFFSPDPPPPPPPNVHPGPKGKANGGRERSEGEGTAGAAVGNKTISSGTMEIVTSSVPPPPSSSAPSARRLTSLPPRARSPIKTNLGTPARRASSVGFSSPDKPSPHRPANRKLDFGGGGTAGDKEAPARLLGQPAKHVSMSPAGNEVHRASSSSSAIEKKKEPEVARTKPKTKQRQAMPKVVEEETAVRGTQRTPPIAMVKKKRGLLMQGKKSALVAGGGKKTFSLQDDGDTGDDEDGDVEMSDGGIGNGLGSTMELGQREEERHPIEEEVSQMLGDEDTIMSDGEGDVQVAPAKGGKGKVKGPVKKKAVLPEKKAKPIPPAKKTQPKAKVNGKSGGGAQAQDEESEESGSGEEEVVEPVKAKVVTRGKGKALVAAGSQPEPVRASRTKAAAKVKGKAKPQVEEISSDSEPEVQAPKPKAAPKGKGKAKDHAQEPESELELEEVQAPKQKTTAKVKAKASSKAIQPQRDDSEVEEIVPAPKPKPKAVAKGKGKGKANSTAKGAEDSAASSSAKPNSKAKVKGKTKVATPPNEDEAEDEQSEEERDPTPPPPPKSRAASRAKGKAKALPIDEPEVEVEPVSSSQKSKAKPATRARGATKSRSKPEREIPESSPALAPVGTIDEEDEEKGEYDDEAALPARKKLRQSPRTAKPAATTVSKGKGKAGVAAGVRKATAESSRRRQDISPELATTSTVAGAKPSASSSSQTAAPRPRGQRVIRERPSVEPDSITNGRPTRHRMKPLEFWKGEKVVYTLTDPSTTTAAASTIKLPEIAEIIRVESDEEEKARDRERRKKRTAAAQSAGNKRKRALKQEDTEEEEFEEEPWESQVTDGEVGVIRGYVKPFPPPASSEQLEEAELAFSRNRIVTVEVANGDFTFVKTCTQPFFGTGMIEIPPGGIKRTKNSGKMHLVFYLLQGKVQVQVGETMFRVRSGGQFMVPRGNLYSIENPYDVQAKMFFAQGCEVEVEGED